MARKKIESIAPATAATEAAKRKVKTKVRVAMAATLGLCLPEALNKKLMADAKKKKIKKSALVRMILEEQYARKSA